VRFHDGDELDAATVCANFDRWYNTTGIYQQTRYTRYWQSVFGGFAEQTGYNEAESNYRSCRVVDGLTAAITVNEYTPALPGGFTYASFGIMSASALAEFEDAMLLGPLSDQSSYLGVLAGTGPFRISEWDNIQQVITLKRFDEHRDGSAGIDTVIMSAITNDAARRQALESGEIHGYERALPEDAGQLERAGFQVPSRDPHRLFYLGFQPEAHEALEVPEIREALARAVDRQSIVNTVMTGDSEVPTQLVPEVVNGWSPDARTIEHSPEAAEELLADAGHGDLTLDLCYPNDLSQVFLPDPEATQNLITQDLEAIGVTVEPVAQSWNDLSDSIRAGDCALYLHTAWGAQNDTLNFLNSYLFTLDQFSGAGSADLAEAFDEARSLPDQDQRRTAYEELNGQLMEFLPVVPIAAFSDATVYSKEIEPPQAGPMPGHENFAEVFWTQP
jgi:peptide/nickel transport system substrate-binding protein